jgi:hypothetical protein
VGDRFATVLAAARAGSEPAWVALYEELVPSVLGYLRAQRAAEPEDLTGEISCSSFGTWGASRATSVPSAPGRSRSRTTACSTSAAEPRAAR